MRLIGQRRRPTRIKNDKLRILFHFPKKQYVEKAPGAVARSVDITEGRRPEPDIVPDDRNPVPDIVPDDRRPGPDIVPNGRRPWPDIVPNGRNLTKAGR